MGGTRRAPCGTIEQLQRGLRDSRVDARKSYAKCHNHHHHYYQHALGLNHTVNSEVAHLRDKCDELLSLLFLTLIQAVLSPSTNGPVYYHHQQGHHAKRVIIIISKIKSHLLSTTTHKEFIISEDLRIIIIKVRGESCAEKRGLEE